MVPASFLQNNGCDEFQGYLFHRPSDVDYIENLFILSRGYYYPDNGKNCRLV